MSRLFLAHEVTTNNEIELSDLKFLVEVNIKLNDHNRIMTFNNGKLKLHLHHEVTDNAIRNQLNNERFSFLFEDKIERIYEVVDYHHENLKVTLFRQTN